MPEEIETQCPFCGEPITIFVDTSIDEQNYIEDCSVCCRPIEFIVHCENGALTHLNVTRGA